MMLHMDVFVYQWTNKTIGNKNVILVFGYTSAYERVCFHIYDWYPSFILEHRQHIALLQKHTKIEPITSKLIRDFPKGDVLLHKVYFNNNEDRSENFFALRNKGIYEVHHSDVQPSLEYISEHGLRTNGWVHIAQYTKIKTPVSKCAIEIAVKNVQPLDKEDILDLGIFSMDIETFSHDRISFPNKYDPRDYIFSISVVYKQRKTKQVSKYIIYQSDVTIKNFNDIICFQTRTEKELLMTYFALMSKLDPDIIIGFNTFSFDYDYIIQRWDRYLHLRFPCSLLQNETIGYERIRSVSNLWNGSSLYNIPITGRCNIDVYQYVIKQMPHLPIKSLNYLSKTFLEKEKLDLPYKEMFECIYRNTESDLRRVFEYCVVDSELTISLYEKFHIFIGSIEMGNMNFMNVEEYYTSGSTAKFRNVLYDIALKNNVVVNGRYKDLGPRPQGAMVFEPQVGIHDWTSVIDFNSLYPSILIAYNLCYSTYLGTTRPEHSNFHEIVIDKKRSFFFMKEPMGFVPKLCQTLLENRKNFKKILKETTDPLLQIIYDQRQNVTKITANSIYGCYGSGYAGIATFREAAECITALGRKYLTETKEILEHNFDVTIVYGDTDSCMVRFNSLQGNACIDATVKMCSSPLLIKHWLSPISIKYELLFSRVIFNKKKKYVGIKFDPDCGKLYVKGTYKSTLCDYTKHVYQTVIRKILTNEPSDAVRSYLVEVISGISTIAIDNLVVRTKTSQEYKSKTYYLARFKENMRNKNIEVNPGELLDLVYVDNNATKVGDKIEMVKYLGNERLDFKYYLKNQIFKSFASELSLFDSVMYHELLGIIQRSF